MAETGSVCVFEVIVLTPNFLGKFTFPFPELVFHSSVLPQRERSVVLRVAVGVALDGPRLGFSVFP